MTSFEKSPRLAYDSNRRIRVRPPVGIVKLIAPIGHVLRKLQGKALTHISRGGIRKATFPPIFSVLPVKELIIRYRSILSGYLNYYTFADNRLRLRYVYSVLRRSLICVLMDKHQVGIREILNRYGPDITLNISKGDGTIVSLKFDCPSLKPMPSKFLGSFGLEGDPLAAVD